MPRIPEYQQRQLASQNVGMGAVDTTAIKILGGIAQTANTAARGFMVTAAREQRALAKLEADRHEAIAKITADRYLIDMKTTVEADVADIQAAQPEKARQNYQQLAGGYEDIIKGYVKKISDPVAQEKFRSGAYSYFNGALPKFRAGMMKTETNYARGVFDETLGIMAKSNEGASGPEALLNGIDAIGEQGNQAVLLFGPDGAQDRITAAQDMFIGNSIAAYATNSDDPEAVQQLLEAPGVREKLYKTIGAKETERYVKEAERRQLRAMDIAEKKRTLEDNTIIAQELGEGNVALAKGDITGATTHYRNAQAKASTPSQLNKVYRLKEDLAASEQKEDFPKRFSQLAVKSQQKIDAAVLKDSEAYDQEYSRISKAFTKDDSDDYTVLTGSEGVKYIAQLSQRAKTLIATYKEFMADTNLSFPESSKLKQAINRYEADIEQFDNLIEDAQAKGNVVSDMLDGVMQSVREMTGQAKKVAGVTFTKSQIRSLIDNSAAIRRQIIKAKEARGEEGKISALEQAAINRSVLKMLPPPEDSQEK